MPIDARGGEEETLADVVLADEEKSSYTCIFRLVGLRLAKPVNADVIFRLDMCRNVTSFLSIDKTNQWEM